MRSDTPRVDWDEIPLYVARAHAMRSAEMHRLLRRFLSVIVGFARRPIAPGGPRRRLTDGPAPSSP